MNTNPASTRVSSCFPQGLSRKLQHNMTHELPNTSIGGTHGFLLYQSIHAIHHLIGTIDYDEAANSVRYSSWTIRGWARQIVPYNMNGGHRDSTWQMWICCYSGYTSIFIQTPRVMLFVLLCTHMVEKYTVHNMFQKGVKNWEYRKNAQVKNPIQPSLPHPS